MRYRRFLQRASFLEVVLSSEGSQLKRYAFPPEQWEGIGLGGVEIPQDPRGSLTVAVRVWDKQMTDPARAYPLLVGQKHVPLREIPREGTASVLVRLSLQVRAETLD